MKKILVVDDEVRILELLDATLRGGAQYEILLARNGEEALQIARQEKPDILFLDVVMPGLDGYEICRVLREDADTMHIKIIVLTALAQESDRGRALEAGADDYMIKPFSPTVLLDKIDDALALWYVDSPISQSGGHSDGGGLGY